MDRREKVRPPGAFWWQKPVSFGGGRCSSDVWRPSPGPRTPGDRGCESKRGAPAFPQGQPPARGQEPGGALCWDAPETSPSLRQGEQPTASLPTRTRGKAVLSWRQQGPGKRAPQLPQVSASIRGACTQPREEAQAQAQAHTLGEDPIPPAEPASTRLRPTRGSGGPAAQGEEQAQDSRRERPKSSLGKEASGPPT